MQMNPITHVEHSKRQHSAGASCSMHCSSKTLITWAFLALFLLTGSACQVHSTQNPELLTEDTAPAKEEATTVVNFPPNTLLNLLTAEMAGYRKQPQLALEYYDKQAQSIQDPQIAERAYRIASYLGLKQPTYDNALLWAKLAPNSAEAQRSAANELIKSRRYQEAMSYVEKAIELEPDSPGYFDWIAFSASHADEDSQQVLLTYFTQLEKKYPQQASLLLAQAILLQDRDPERALQLIEQSPSHSASLPSLLLKSRLLLQLGQTEASLATTQEILALQPENEQLRFSYARQLVNAERLEDAREELLLLADSNPFEDDYRLALGYIHMDLNEWQEAIGYFEELIARESYTDTALYNLARCYQELGEPELAIATYMQVPAGPNYLAAIQRQGSLLLQLQQFEQFADLFQNAQQETPDVSIQLYLIETETLTRFQFVDQAWQRIQMALTQFPNEHQLLYTRAMVADKKGDITQLKQDLSYIIEQDPNNNIALNALGYTLTNHGDDLNEALTLIQRAHSLDPDDPATLDSLGWVYFKLNQPELALKYLQQAYDRYPDAEIAAHLGEVLWSLGEKRQARAIWNQALESDSDDPTLLETMQRLDRKKGWF